MGYTTWNSTASTATYAARSADYVSRDMTREQIFASREVKPQFDPAKITFRESCDSELNPNSTPIILGLDVTGSMGFIPEYLIKSGFGPLIESLIANHPISDPHIMMQAIGDLTCDSGPLQATQFETDIRIVEQLAELWLEGRGGGNNFESYDLAWFFAAEKCKIDCWTKRNKRGYLFTFGDEPPPLGWHRYSEHQLQRVGFKFQQPPTTLEILKKAMEQWAVFHVVVEEGNHCRYAARPTIDAWMNLFGEAGNATNLICLNDHKKLPQVVTAVLQVAEGADPDEVLSQAAASDVDAIRHAFGQRQ